ncbi:hypothetical protein [uncultured Microbacterium sp.]|uniref:hypothetical protein n=1 Tax=uncultured Microbacterium sp. TaxID=191216 RepID=UPI0025F8AF7C|nr:hypothetical protein [uncultured Microbacterium sp.]
MATWVWVIAIVVGTAMWLWSIGLTLRAYRGARVPLWRAPRKAPGAAVALRAVGLALGVMGMSPTSGMIATSPGGAAIVAAVLMTVLFLAPLFIALLRHNARVDADPT